MNNLDMRVTLALGLLALAAVPAHAQQYVVEPIVDEVTTTPVDGEYTQAELDQMLAPIALYPDSLLSQILVAATYPLEIVEAARWSRQNPQLEGEDAVAAAADRNWDPSVKALVAFPELLARMDEDLDWTRNLGDAMLYQESQVMDSIQFLRARADAAGSLESTEYARVIREEKTIIIEPTRTHVVHVPYYDPYVVYGSWWWPAYPPVVWAVPSYYYHGHPGFYWGSGIRLSSGFFFSSFYWPQRSIVIVHTPRYYHAPRHRPYRPYYTAGQRWQHNPAHRRGVAYRHKDVRQRYDQPRLKAGPATRWPLESGRTRADRGAYTGSHTGSRLDAARRDRRTDAARSDWREPNVRTSRETRNPSSTGRETDGARLTAGPRTLRPNVNATGERLRGTRESARPGRTEQRAEQVASQRQRPATVERRTVSPSRRVSSAPRATAPAARSSVRSPRAVSRAPQARTQSRSTAAPAPAHAPQARSQGRSSERSAGSRAAPRARSESRDGDTRRGSAGQEGRRFD